jgi:hypothetical protein
VREIERALAEWKRSSVFGENRRRDRSFSV